MPRQRKPGGRLYATGWVTPDAHQVPVLWSNDLSWRAGLSTGGGMGWWLKPDIAIQMGGNLRRTLMDPAVGTSLNYHKGWFVGTPLHLYFYPNLPGKQFKEVNCFSVALMPTFFQPINEQRGPNMGFTSLHAEVGMGFSRKPTPRWEIRCETILSYPLVSNALDYNMLVGFRMSFLRKSYTL